MKAKRQSRRLASDKAIVGKPLISNAAIAEKYAKSVQAMIREMARDTVAELKAMFSAPGYALDGDHFGGVENGSPAARSQIILNKLMRKYRGKFDDLATMATDRMIKATLKHVDTTAGLSLREMGAGLELPDFWSARLREIVAASTKEATQLIRTIPERFLSQVQGQTMRAITSGRGMADLTPFLAKKYGQNLRKAKNVALDQTRKAYSNLSAQRMQDAGVEEFEWRHSHGGHDPRKQHQGWNGKVFRYDDPPVDETFGPVLPGQAINCKCFARPRLKFGDNRNGT
ncbi:minor capsid protein [Rhizobium freirei]|nr:minor capsid protein [Rhizobium freirei]